MNKEFSDGEKDFFDRLFNFFIGTRDFKDYYKFFFDEAIKSKARQLFDLQELCRLNVKISKHNIDQYYKTAMDLAFLFVLKKKFDFSEFNLNEEDCELCNSYLQQNLIRRIKNV